MKRVQLIGSEPATVNFSDPALPPRMTVEKIHAGIKVALVISQGGAGNPRSASSTPTRSQSRQLNVAWQVMSTTA